MLTLASCPKRAAAGQQAMMTARRKAGRDIRAVDTLGRRIALIIGEEKASS